MKEFSPSLPHTVLLKYYIFTNNATEMMTTQCVSVQSQPFPSFTLSWDVCPSLWNIIYIADVYTSRQVQPTKCPLGAVGLQSRKTATQEISQHLNRFSISHYTVFSATPEANIVSYSFKLYRQEVQPTFEKFCSWITVVFSRFTYEDIYNWNQLFLTLVISSHQCVVPVHVDGHLHVSKPWLL